jgi:hypothetical protein
MRILKKLLLLLAIYSLCAGQITYAVTRDILEDGMKRAVNKAFAKLPKVNWVKLTKESIEDGLEIVRLDVKPVLDTTHASITGSGGNEFRLNIGELTLHLDLDYVINENIKKKIGKLLWKVLAKFMKIKRQGNVIADIKFRCVTLSAKSFLEPDVKQIGHQRFM